MNEHARPHPELPAIAHAKFIRLGVKSSWAALAIEEGVIPFDHDPLPEELIHRAEPHDISRALQARGMPALRAGRLAREIAVYHQSGADMLWVTFWQGKMWWAFAQGPARASPGEAGKIFYRRPTLAGWRSTDLRGAPLVMRDLDGDITKTAGYRATICAIADVDRLRRVVSGEIEPWRRRLTDHSLAGEGLALTALSRLHWKDFEVLADLLMLQGGWRRTSELGGTQAEFDGHYSEPLRGQRAAIQVKAQAGSDELQRAIRAFEACDSAEQLFFFTHGPRPDLEPPGRDDVVLLAGPDLARAVLRCGLLDWMVARSA